MDPVHQVKRRIRLCGRMLTGWVGLLGLGLDLGLVRGSVGSRGRTPLGVFEQGAVALLELDALAGVLVVRRKTGRVGGNGRDAIHKLLESVGALAGGVAVGVEDGGVHEMHFFGAVCRPLEGKSECDRVGLICDEGLMCDARGRNEGSFLWRM